MSALYSHTTRAVGITLTAAIYNADHQNHITNGVPAQLGDYSSDATEMKVTTDPGSTGSESLATSLAGELERLRYAIDRIVGKTNWYDAPDTTLDVVAANEAIVLLTSGSVSAAATLDIDISSYTSYRGLKILISDFHPVTDEVPLRLRVSIDGGSTFVTSADYSYALKEIDSQGGEVTGQVLYSGAANYITLCDDVDTVSTSQVNMEITCMNQASTTRWSMFDWRGTFVENANLLNHVTGSGAHQTADDITDIRLYFSSGNIDAGEYAVYGLK